MGNEFARKDLTEKRTSAGSPTVQRKPNNTGMPDTLKSGVESLSGMSMNDVHVHYNSSKPSQLQAHAYAQGTDIHVAPGQESNLPHEAWHVVQQKQGRVTPTMQMKGSSVNDDASLEQEADTMGGRVLQAKMQEGASLSEGHASGEVVQRASDYNSIMPNHSITQNKLDDQTRNPEGDKTFSQMKLTYHHIIGEDILKEVFTQSLQPMYNYCLEHDEVEGADELVEAVEELIETGVKFREQTVENDTKMLHKNSENHEFNFSKDADVSKKKERKGAIDGDFGAAIRWIPGNVHQGPSNRTHLEKKSEIKDAKSLAKLYTDGGDFNQDYIRDNPEVLKDDGGAGFEYAAGSVVGNERIKQLAQLLTDMFKLPHFAQAAKPKPGDKIENIATYPKISAAITDVKKIINTINSLFYDQDGEEREGKKPFRVPKMDLGRWEKTDGKEDKDAEWTLKSDQEKLLKVQVKSGKTGYANVEAMYSKMSALTAELNKHDFLKNDTKVSSKILENEEVRDMEIFLIDTAGSFQNMSIISYLKGWKLYNQDAYIRLMQNFKTASRKFLIKYTDSQKNITGCAMVKSSYEKLYEEFAGFHSFFGRSVK